MISSCTNKKNSVVSPAKLPSIVNRYPVRLCSSVGHFAPDQFAVWFIFVNDLEQVISFVGKFA